MAARLREERHRLDELRAGDFEVRASFRVTYDSLHELRHRGDPARAFRLLSLYHGQRVSLPAAAALVGGTAEDVAIALEDLVDANLLESPEPDQYQFHDLLRLFAAERAQAEEPEASRRAAVARLLRWYLGMAVASADVLSPRRYRLPADDSRSPGKPLFRSAAAALGWYDSERENISAAIRQAAATELHDIAWRLPTALFPLFNRRADRAGCIAAHRIAVSSARMTGHRQGRPGRCRTWVRPLPRQVTPKRLPASQRRSASARKLATSPVRGRAWSRSRTPAYRLQRPEEAITHSLRGLEVLRRTGNPAHFAVALSNHGEFCMALGRLNEAADCFREALGIGEASETSTAYERGIAMENLGRVHLEMGSLDEAIACLTGALLLHEASGFLIRQAVTLKDLGRAQRAAGYEGQARESLEAALVLFEKLNAEADAEAIRSALSSRDLRCP